jgi:DNA (cytosine-5)-methyltransferase 1
LNHDPAAIEMHRENHPHTEHAISDVFEIDPRKEEFAYLENLDALWASPDCRHFSKAKGAALVSAKVRGLAWSTIAWLKAKQPRILFLENVEEFQSWGPIHRDPEHPEHGRPIQSRKGETFRKFISKLGVLGYRAQWRVLNAANYGAPTARKRLFLIARRDGQTINWPKATHGPGLKPYHTAAECIDWSIPTSSIFGRKKPLADKTLARIAHGIVRHVIDDPAPYVAPIEGQDVAAFFTPRYGERPTQAPRSRDIRRPMPTIVGTGNGATLCTATLAKFYGTANSKSIEQPLDTVTAGGNKFGLVSAMLSKHYGGVVGNRLDQPLGTITSSDSQGPTAARLEQVEPNEQTDRVAAFLVKYYGTGHGQTLKAPLHTVTTKGRFAMVTARIDGETYAITDIGMRMLQPRELAKAQGFPESYHLIGTQAQQIAKLGNSVPPPVARALVASNVPTQPQTKGMQA